MRRSVAADLVSLVQETQRALQTDGVVGIVTLTDTQLRLQARTCWLKQ